MSAHDYEKLYHITFTHFMIKVPTTKYADGYVWEEIKPQKDFTFKQLSLARTNDVMAEVIKEVLSNVDQEQVQRINMADTDVKVNGKNYLVDVSFLDDLTTDPFMKIQVEFAEVTGETRRVANQMEKDIADILANYI